MIKKTSLKVTKYNKIKTIISKKISSLIFPTKIIKCFMIRNIILILIFLKRVKQIYILMLQDIINRHTLNHITAARFIKYSLEQDRGSNLNEKITNKSIVLNKGKCEFIIVDFMIEKEKSDEKIFSDLNTNHESHVNNFKHNDNNNNVMNNLIKSCNVENVTKTQLDKIKEIVNKGLDKDLLRKSEKQ